MWPVCRAQTWCHSTSPPLGPSPSIDEPAKWQPTCPVSVYNVIPVRVTSRTRMPESTFSPLPLSGLFAVARPSGSMSTVIISDIKKDQNLCIGDVLIKRFSSVGELVGGHASLECFKFKPEDNKKLRCVVFVCWIAVPDTLRLSLMANEHRIRSTA